MSVEKPIPQEAIESISPEEPPKVDEVKLTDGLEDLDEGAKELFLMRVYQQSGDRDIGSEKEYDFYTKRLEYLDKKPFDSLSPEDKGNYIETMACLAPKKVVKEGPYYYFGPSKIHETGSKEAEAAQLLTAVNDPEFNKELSQEELELMLEVEKDTFKVHLDIPKEMKLVVLRRLLETEKQDALISSKWFSEKEKQGESIIGLEFSTEERVKEGIQLDNVLRYKMSEVDSENHQLPDFVFYVNPKEGQTPKEALKAMAHELHDVFSDLDIPESDDIPRFSQNVEIDGEIISWMSFVQGNGDLKNYILDLENGAEVLRKIYPEKNFSAMEKIEF